jgi:hypothetical protein
MRESRIEWFFRLVQKPGRYGNLLASPGIPAVLMPFAKALHKSFRGGPLAVAAEPAKEPESAVAAA